MGPNWIEISNAATMRLLRCAVPFSRNGKDLQHDDDTSAVPLQCCETCLKIQCPQGRVGSTPTFGTSYEVKSYDKT